MLIDSISFTKDYNPLRTPARQREYCVNIYFPSFLNKYKITLVMKRHIFHILYNPFTSDSRVTKELITIERLYPQDNITLMCRFKTGLPTEEILGNRIKILRLGPEDKKNSRLYKLINWLRWFLECSRFLFSKQFHVLHCHDLTGIPIGFFFKLIREFKLIYDSHEFQSEIHNVPNWRKPVTRFFEQIFILSSDVVITVSHSIAHNYKYLFGIKIIQVLLNTPEKVDIGDSERPDFFPANKKVLLFQGGLTPKRGIEKTIAAFKEAKLEDYCLVFMGNGPLESFVRTQLSNNILLVPPVSMQKLPYISSHAFAGLLFYENTCLNHYFCMPNKLFEYINSEIPVIASNLYELRDVVNSYKIGTILEEMNSASLLQAIQLLETQASDQKNNLQVAKSHFNWENQVSILKNVYST